MRVKAGVGFGGWVRVRAEGEPGANASAEVSVRKPIWSWGPSPYFP